VRGTAPAETVTPMNVPRQDHPTTASVPEGPSAGTSGDPVACAACDHGGGWWGTGLPGENHCPDCHRYWNSSREGHCAGCCRHFASNAAFDAHRIGDACHDPATLTRQDGRHRFTRRDGRLGTTWVLVNYRRLPDFSALG